MPGDFSRALPYVLFAPRVVAIAIVLVLAHVLSATLAGLSATPGASTTGAGSVELAEAVVGVEGAGLGTAPESGASERIRAPAAITSAAASRDPVASLILLAQVIAVCVLEALALGVFVAAASARGWRLALGLAVLTFGVLTLQPQIEAVAFGVIRLGTAARIGLMGLVISVIAAAFTVLVFGRFRAGARSLPEPPALVTAVAPARMPVRPGRAFALGGIVFVPLYFLFGYFVAWQSSEVRAFYGGEASQGFQSHLWSLQLRLPWFVPFQFLRGGLWALLGLAALPLLGGSWTRAGVVLGVFFAVVMNAQLLLPNAMMPEPVRLVHIAETAPANFILGVLLTLLLRQRIHPAREKHAFNARSNDGQPA